MEPQGHNLKLTLDILELMTKSKKKVIGGFNGSFLRNLVGGGHSSFNFFKRGLLKKIFGNSNLNEHNFYQTIFFLKSKLSSICSFALVYLFATQTYYVFEFLYIS